MAGGKNAGGRVEERKKEKEKLEGGRLRLICRLFPRTMSGVDDDTEVGDFIPLAIHLLPPMQSGRIKM